ncbi:tellurite resistance TerB family protein [Arenibaculum sp.]|jgi:uncharacterized membrane protein YebE (DUF533 family)|uniref:tellurite resistance TerB family protein n=1 Tax=Arenibaculum sp. TaxID=2865862 RepID=UPI002E1079DD|nr:DUF533 domain-containing protein [Arenibaculum sp.]
MADMKKVLGTMMATGLAGRAMRGPHFARRGTGMSNAFIGRGGGSMKQTAGLAALAYLGYRAYQDYQRNQPQGQTKGQAQRPGGTGTAPSQGGGLADMLGGIFGGAGGGTGGGTRTTGGAGGLGDRLADVLRGGRGAEPEPPPPPPPPPPEETLDDRKALLLVRAMIAAAYADGELSPEERTRIVGALDQAGAGPEEHRIIEGELSNPQPLDAILREVRDEETAEQVYIASEIAIRDGSQTEKHYLNYLASRLNIPEERRNDLDGMVGGGATGG